MGRAVVNIIEISGEKISSVDIINDQVLAINDKNESIVGFLVKDNLQWNCQNGNATLLNVKKVCLLKEIFP